MDVAVLGMRTSKSRRRSRPRLHRTSNDGLRGQVFNYPTISEAYKVAALDVMNKVRALNRN